MKRQFWVNSAFFLLWLTFFSCSHVGQELDPLDDYFNLAVELHNNREYDRSEIYYKKCLSLDYNQSDCLFNLALLYLETERPEQARPLLEKLLKLDRENRSVINAMGVVYSQQEEWSHALEWYDKSLNLFPWDPMALYNGALVYIIQEDSEGARKNLETLWERDRSYRTYTALYPYYKNEDSEKKIQILLQVETESEEEKMALEEELLKIYLDDASHEKALPLLDSLYEQRISSHKERGGEYLFIKGDILMSLYRTEEGLSSLRQAFREGYHNRESIADLAGRLAPSTKHILLEWEKLYLDPVKTD